MKHPILGNRVWLIIWWLAWLFLALGQSLLFYLAYGSFTKISILDSVISLFIYSGLALFLWFPFSYFSTGQKKMLTLVSNLVLTGAITITFWILITRFIMTTIIPDDLNYESYWNITFPYRLGTGVIIYFLVVVAFYLNVSLADLSEKNAREAKLESIVKETELRLLRSQINPHFLFNSLNSISSLTISDPEKARDMIVKLSEFMRYSLSRKDEQPVTLRSELENLMLYLDIEKVRFGDRLTTEESIDSNCLDFKIPVLLLQPLYENAVKHGVYESAELVKIATTARFSGNYIEIIISNNYNPAPQPRKGTATGLANVSRRMELFYGKNASLTSDRENGIFTVTLYMPAETDENSGRLATPGNG